MGVSAHLGTPRRIVDSAGTTVWQAAYYPFGKAQLLTQTIPCNLRFPGQYFDQETGLHYNFHRYYNPETGRYLTADPIGLQGGINLYAYVGNDPVNAVDPEGLISCNDARYNGVSDCIDEYRRDYESCGECDKACKLRAKKEFKECLKLAYGRCNEDLNGDGKVDKWDDVGWFFMRLLYNLRTPPGSSFPPGYGKDGPGSIDNPPVPPQA